MGRMLGAFDNPSELDRPDLNKCPDCECYFAGDNCPLCGKPCPEQMKAGNRKPPKKEKPRHSSRGKNYFISWYHRWWIIALAMFLSPVLGIILLVTSPHKKSAKITFVAIGIAYLLVSTIGIGSIFGMVRGWIDPPVNTSLSREEYIEKCNVTGPEEFYRNADKYEDKYISIALIVTEIVIDAEAFYSNDKYPEYFVCKAPLDDRFVILIRNCVQDSSGHLVVGDAIEIYGEGAGDITIQVEQETSYANFKTYSAPAINAAYVSLIQPSN